MSFDYFSKRRMQYFLEKLKDIFDTKVDKVSGKGLSTNDYTTTEKNKLAGITVNNGTLTVTQNGTSKGTFTANQSGNATIALTDTTYSSKAAASGGTDVSLVTTGEKYTWNNKGNGTVTQVKVGSTAYNPTSGVVSLPAYPTDTNTHRPIQMNGTEILGNNTTALNLKAGSNVTLTNSSGTVTIAAANTWRPVVDNLTSTAIDSSLSANQGRLLANGSARDSTKLATDQLGLQAIKVTRGASISTSTIGYWAAMCNTSTLPTASKWWHVLNMDWNDTKNWVSQLAIATQDGSGVWWRRNDQSNTEIDSSTWHRLAEADANGKANSAATADKLTTARNIALAQDFAGSANFDGSGNISISAHFYSANISGGNKANYPWHRFSAVTNVTGSFVDKDAIIILRSHYYDGPTGAIKISLRTNDASTSAACVVSARWLYRYGFAVDDVKIAYWGTSGQAVYADVFVKCAAYPRRNAYQIVGNRDWTLVSSNEVNNTTTTDKLTSTEVYVSVESAATEIHGKAYTSIVNAVDATRVNYANDSAKVNGLTVQTAVPANAKFTDTTYNFSGTTFYSGNKDNSEHNANNAIKNGNYYYTSNGPATSLGASTNDGALYVQSHSDPWVGQIAQDYRNGGLYVRGKNNGTWQSWYKVWDSRNLSSKAAAASGTDLSLVTTGEKATWNAKGSGTVTQVKVGSTAYNPSSGVISLPAYPTDTNNAVTQTEIDATEDTSYEILLSGTADNTTRTEGAKKYSGLTFNPNKQKLSAVNITTNSISTNGIGNVQLANGDFIYRGSNAKGYMSTGILSTPLRFGLYHGTNTITAASTDITNAGETGTVLDVNGTVSGQKVVNLYKLEVFATYLLIFKVQNSSQRAQTQYVFCRMIHCAASNVSSPIVQTIGTDVGTFTTYFTLTTSTANGQTAVITIKNGVSAFIQMIRLN